MSQYTTGELAKLCGVTVRTVQYYHSRNILVPSALSEGGRRLYSEEDLKKLRIICFLRELDMPIQDIGQLFREENPGEVIDLMLQQQTDHLKDQLKKDQLTLSRLEQLRREVRETPRFSVESIGDIAHIMEGRKKLRRLRLTLIAVGIPLDLLEIWAVALWVTRGIWWPFLAWILLDIVLGGWVSLYYMKRVAYICPECHQVFVPGFRENLFARHTPRARKLHCPNCQHWGFCVEVYGGS